jgi:hypothetical protein
VRGYNQEMDDYTAWSEIWNFTTFDFESQQVVLLTPTNESTDLMFNANFSWDELDEADTYELQIASDQQFGSIVYSKNTSELSTQAQNLEVSTNYFWRVRAYNTENDKYSSWSNIWTFTTAELIDKNVTLKMFFKGFYDGTEHDKVAVIIELRSGDNLMTSENVIQKPAIVNQEGEVSVNFSEVEEGDYWILVRAIGYLPVCTPDKYTLDGTDVEHDFTTSSSQSVAGNSTMIEFNDEWYIVGGDLNGDRSVAGFDVNEFIPVLGRSVANQIPGN